MHSGAHQLPAGLLLSLFGGLKLVVLGDVPVQGAHHNHGHHATQEEDDHEGVDDGEPMDLVICHDQVGVPIEKPTEYRFAAADKLVFLAC